MSRRLHEASVRTTTRIVPLFPHVDTIFSSNPPPSSSPRSMFSFPSSSAPPPPPFFFAFFLLFGGELLLLLLLSSTVLVVSSLSLPLSLSSYPSVSLACRPSFSVPSSPPPPASSSLSDSTSSSCPSRSDPAGGAAFLFGVAPAMPIILSPASLPATGRSSTLSCLPCCLSSFLTSFHNNPWKGPLAAVSTSPHLMSRALEMTRGSWRVRVTS
mmetsp:Transcript_50772/g.69077  ORF Transcript_50772/g.69077 Transcript_50772/m.69077 type:complete len:213 (+) Transcript_50772:682-1320(+)